MSENKESGAQEQESIREKGRSETADLDLRVVGQAPHGSIIFETPAGRALELKGDGTILVRGRVVGMDSDVVEAFRGWVENAKVIWHGNAVTTPGTPGGEMRIQSGRAAGPHKGGNVIFDASKALAPEELARFFHETYERLAPSFGYETRKDSASPWAQVPEKNRRLMVAVAAEVLAEFGKSNS